MFDPITALVVASVAATGASVYSGEKSRSQTKKANRVQERVRQTQDKRARLAQVRQARLAQAQVLQSGATQGATNSSAVQGGYSAIGSNAENNIQFINQIDSMQQAINKRMESANNYRGAASTFGGIASITGSLAGSGKPETKAPITAGGTSTSNIGIN
tara:strand:- start:304 stop:780 length:477 start_codon:yes stop_codon:yes gene_type:complete